MQEYIFILFSEMEDLAHYIVMDETGKQITASDQEDTLKSLSYLCLNRQVIVLIPGKYVSFYKVTLPYGAREKLQSSLPYVLEEEISEDIENLNFILGPKLIADEQNIKHSNEDDDLAIEDETQELLIDAEQIADDHHVDLEEERNLKVNTKLNKISRKSSQYIVAVISKEVMDYYFSLFKKNNIKPDYLLSDNYCLSGQYKNQIYINGIEKQVYFLSKEDDIYTLDLDNFEFFQDKLLDKNNAKIEIYNYRFDQKLNISNINKINQVNSEVELFATKWLTQKVKMNFLTGKYKIFKVQLKNKLLWKAVLSLIIFILLADFGISVGKYLLISNQVSKVNEQIVTQWNKVFPKNMKVQLPSDLSEVTTLIARETSNAEKQEVQNNFFSALNILGITLNEYTNVTLEGISFLESQLKIKIITPNIIILNNFEKAFRAKDKRIKRISLKEEKGAFVAGFMITVG